MERVDYPKLLAAFLLSLLISGAIGLASFGFYNLINYDVRAAASAVVAVLIAIALTPTIYRRIKD